MLKKVINPKTILFIGGLFIVLRLIFPVMTLQVEPADCYSRSSCFIQVIAHFYPIIGCEDYGDKCANKWVNVPRTIMQTIAIGIATIVLIILVRKRREFHDQSSISKKKSWLKKLQEIYKNYRHSKIADHLLIEKISKEAHLTQKEKELFVEISKLPSTRDMVGDEIYNTMSKEEIESYEKSIFNEEFIARAKKSNFIMASTGIILLSSIFIVLIYWRDLLPKNNKITYVIVMLCFIIGSALTLGGIDNYCQFSKIKKSLRKIKEISENK